jgi:hypothetical protein
MLVILYLHRYSSRFSFGSYQHSKSMLFAVSVMSCCTLTDQSDMQTCVLQISLVGLFTATAKFLFFLLRRHRCLLKINVFYDCKFFRSCQINGPVLSSHQYHLCRCPFCNNAIGLKREVKQGRRQYFRDDRSSFVNQSSIS